MRLVPVASVACGSAQCPTIYVDADESGGVFVQGYVVPEQRAPTGEAVVRIPRHLLLEAARSLSEAG